MLSSARRGSLWCGLVALAALGPRSVRAQTEAAAAPVTTGAPTSASSEADLPPPPPPQPKARQNGRLRLGVPEVVPARRRGHVHDGFYLRFGLGASYGRASVQTDRVSQLDVVVTGIGPSADLWVGWTVAPGLVLGPAISTLGAATGGAEVGTDQSAGSGSASGVLIGAFIDAYPVSEDGYHFGGVLSLASLSQTTESGADEDYVGGGVGVSIFAGYDAWIAREWSLGGMLRLGGVVTRRTESIDEQDVTRQGTLYGAALLFSVVHH